MSARAASLAVDQAFARKVRKLHDMGPRVLAEALAEIAADRLLYAYIDQLLNAYTSIDIDALKMAGADRFPLPPLRLVQP